MSSYWDSVRTEVRLLSEQHKKSPDLFVEQVRLLEDRVLRIVDLTTGDRDFPDDLRQKIQGIIAMKSLRALDILNRVLNEPGTAPGVRTGGSMSEFLERAADPERDLRSFWYHELFEDLHSAFHKVAERRHEHRFGGWFSDNPDGFLRIRDEATSDNDAGGSQTD